MTDFEKVKIGFAIALAAALFTLEPVISKYGHLGYSIQDYIISISYAYYAIMVFLGIAVYCYAFDFITENDFRFAHKIGNFLYAFSLLIPILYLLVWISIVVGAFIEEKTEGIIPDLLQSLIFVLIASIPGFIYSYITTKYMNRRDKESSVDLLVREEGTHFKRSLDMLKSGHYDLAVLEAFRAVETALRRAFVDSDLKVRSLQIGDLITGAYNNKIIPANMAGAVDKIRRARNSAVHGDASKPVTEAQADEIVSLAREVLNSIRVPLNDDPVETKEDEKNSRGNNPK